LEFFAGRGLDYHTGFQLLLPTELTDEPLDALISTGETKDVS
jgi:hypothetical protein